MLVGSSGFAAILPVVPPGAGGTAPPGTGATSTETVAVTINLVTGSLVNFGYRTPNGNRPRSFANAVHLWAVTDDQVPWGRPPAASVTIVGDLPTGDQNLENIDITNDAYLLGYAVGPHDPAATWSPYADVVATAYIPAGNFGAAVFSPRLAPRFVGTMSLAFDFAFPDGFVPRASGAWAGLWPGHAASTTVAPAWSAAVEAASESGTWGLDGLQLDRGRFYTLGLFPTGWPAGKSSAETAGLLDLRRLACAVTFCA